ncbi:MAG: hypothetical protein U0Q12_15030 [Vicinamibacterales bacterium]
MRLVCLSVLLTFGAQAVPRHLDPAAVPVDREPQHALRFTNGFVRILEAVLPPGYTTLEHAHMADSVFVTIAPGDPPTSGADAPKAPGERDPRLGRAVFAAGGYSHVARNQGRTEMRIMDVEILKAESGGAPAPSGRGHALELENERVRVYRVTLGPHESLTAHAHDAGRLAVVVSGGAGAGTWSWHASGAPVTIAAGDRPLELVEIEPR